MKRLMIAAGLMSALAWFILTPAPAPACPFCSSQGQTFTMEIINQCAMVIYGTPTNARLKGDGEGETDLIIEEIVKDHPFLKDKKQVVLPKFIPADKQNPVKFLVFCDFFKGKLDPYRGIPVKDKAIVDYLKGALAVKDKDPAERLPFFFKYLDNADLEVSADAYKEFSVADYKAVEKMIEKTDKAKMAAQLVKWIKDNQTPQFRLGLYGYLLGQCGTANDADELKKLLDDHQKGLTMGVDGVLAGYIHLKPREGWNYLLGVVKDKEFTRQYAALRTLRYYWDNPTEIITKKEVLSAVASLLESDIADLAVDDLRKWQQWQFSDQIIGLGDKQKLQAPIFQRAILRYALSCPASEKKAAAFLADQRKKDPEKVKDVEEFLKYETTPTPAPQAKTESKIKPNP